MSLTHPLPSRARRTRKDSPSVDPAPLPPLVGSSPTFKRALAQAEQLATTDATVLISGPTGSGKELFAQRIHALSRRPGRFVPVNCATLSGALADAELFGHVRGAFTGATHERIGLIQQASGGTLFLDEVGELPLDTQASLLRVLQEKTVRPVGAAQEQRLDVRILAATHRNLKERVAQGLFREDLYFRLVEGEVQVPSLADRSQDIPSLARALLSMGRSPQDERWVLSHSAARVLMAYPWPGNVRELKSVLKRLQREARGRTLRASAVRALLAEAVGQTPAPATVLELLGPSTWHSTAWLSEQLRRSRTSILRELERLSGAGEVERTGQGRSTRYRRANSESRAPNLSRVLEGETCPTAECVTAAEVPAEPLEEESGSAEQRLLALLYESQPAGQTFDALQEVFPGLSRNTLKGLLRRLKEAGRIYPQGRTRGARWHARDPFLESS